MIQSMTAFANRTGQSAGQSTGQSTGSSGGWTWTWDMRSVNARGLDLRLRLPDGIEGLEPAVRAAIAARVSRGNVTLNLRLARLDAGQPLALDKAQLDRVLGALEQVQERAFAMGVTLAQATAADVLAQRGVIAQVASEDQDNAYLFNALKDDLNPLLDEFCTMRLAEGQALGTILSEMLDRIANLTDAAAKVAEARRGEARAALSSALRRVFEDVPEIDEARIVQELALIAVKADVTEEIDRLRAHVAAARALLAAPAPAGRKLDFLMQEFNREANTLCSKAQSTELTGIGLDLKAAIEQMREQIQNVE